MTPLSVVIITFNEEKHIGNCLKSVRTVADEIVVVDSFSTDKTREICLQYNVKLLEHAFEGFVEQKNFALSQATHPHVLAMDADEQLSPALQASVLQVKENWQFDGYTFNRLNNFCGKWIHHSGWYPDCKLRLFDKRKGKWTGILLHEKVKMEDGATTGWIKGDLLHYSIESLTEHLVKIDHYTTLAANELMRTQHSTSRTEIYLRMIATFLKAFVFNYGFLDGKAGLQIALMNARYTKQKYFKLLLLQQGK